jgi:hypothetical protein
MNKQAVESVSGDSRDVLIVISDDRAAEEFKQLSAGYRVSQVASPRVVVVEGSPGALAGLRSIPGVTVVTGSDTPPGLTEGLDEGEALFVAAWLSRSKEGPPKQRPGEGLPWDAPGFLPPDPPATEPEPDKKKDEEDERRETNGR